MVNDITGASANELSNTYRGREDDWLRANMVLTLDGNYVDPSGSSRGLSCEADLSLLLMLRAISDVVLVGANTARKENYPMPSLRPSLAEISSIAPRLCVVSQTLEISNDLRMFKEKDVKPIILTGENKKDTWIKNLERLSKVAQVIVTPAPLTGKSIVDCLRKLSLRKIVCEGGPSLLTLLQQDSLIDELDLTYAPVLTGQLATQPALGVSASRWHCDSVLKEGDHIFTRFTRSQTNDISNSLVK